MDEQLHLVADAEEEHPVIALALDSSAAAPEQRRPVVLWGPSDDVWGGNYPPEPEQGLRVLGMLWFPEIAAKPERFLQTLWVVDAEADLPA